MSASQANSKPSESTSLDAFISYSRRDKEFVARLHRCLAKYSPPSGLLSEKRRLRVFLDQSDFTGVDYFDAIQAHLGNSRKLILICTPAAAKSEFVGDEIERFAQLHDPSDIIPVLWKGVPNNEAQPGQEAERAFPQALCEMLEMPLAVDFRGYQPSSMSPDRGAFQSAWMMLLANLLGVSRAEVEERELRRRRQTRRLWSAGVATVFAALSALSIWALVEGEHALARQLAAQASLPMGLELELVERRVLLANESARRLSRLGKPTLVADTALRAALSQVPRRLLALPGAEEQRVAVSADGEYLFVSRGVELVVHSLSNGEVVKQVSLEMPLREIVTGRTPNVVAGLRVDGSVRVWRWPDWRPQAPPPVEVTRAPIDCVAVADDGLMVALRILGDENPEVELLSWWSDDGALFNQAVSRKLNGAVAPAGSSCLVAQTDDGQSATLALLEITDTEQISTALYWRIKDRFLADDKPASGQPQVWGKAVAGTLVGTGPGVLLPDGRVVFNGDIGEPTWDRWGAHRDPIALSSDAQWVVVREWKTDPYVPLLNSTLFDVADSGSGGVLQSVADSGGEAVFTPDQTTLVTVAGNRLRLWDRRDGRERLRLFTQSPNLERWFDAPSRRLVTLAEDGSIEVFDIGSVGTVAVVPDGIPYALFGDAAQPAIALDDRLLLPPSAIGEAPRTVSVEGFAYDLLAAPDASHIALTLSKDRPASIFSKTDDDELLVLATGEQIEVRYRGKRAEQLRFTEDSRRLLAVSDDGHIRMIDLTTGKSAWETQVAVFAPSSGVSQHRSVNVALAQDGNLVAIGHSNGLLVIDGGDGTVVHEEDTPSGIVAFSPDGSLLARSTSSGSVEVMRTSSGIQLASLQRLGDTALKGLMFSPEGRQLVTVAGTVFGTSVSQGWIEEHFHVWDIETASVVQRLPHSRVSPEDYQAAVGEREDERVQFTDLVWDDRSSTIAAIVDPSMLAYWTVGSDFVRRRLVVWRLGDDSLEEIYRQEDSRLRPIAFGSAGKLLVAESEQGWRHILDLSSERLRRIACSVVERGMTPKESSEYLGSLRRAFTCS